MPETTFGHAPRWFNVGYCGGCPECGDREETEACVRCGTEWPCATARVLGVADLEPGESS